MTNYPESSGKGLTNFEFIFLKLLVPHSMIFCRNQHMHKTRAYPLLRELHLENSVINRFTGYLSREEV